MTAEPIAYGSPPALRFARLDLQESFGLALEFRRDSFACSFGNENGFWSEVGAGGSLYREKIASRISDPAWGYFHALHAGRIIGQVEFKDYSQYEGWGYVHLFYLVPSYRGLGLFKQLEAFVIAALRARQCKGVVLSVARGNERALQAYRSHGWLREGRNPKHASSDFYALRFG